MADHERDAADWIANAADAVLACRASGHSWPKLRTGRQRRGITIRRERTGAYTVTFVCSDCGTARTLTTDPGGMISERGSGTLYVYDYPDGYRAPRGSDVRRRDCLNELWTRAASAAGGGAAPPRRQTS